MFGRTPRIKKTLNDKSREDKESRILPIINVGSSTNQVNFERLDSGNRTL